MQHSEEFVGTTKYGTREQAFLGRGKHGKIQRQHVMEACRVWGGTGWEHLEEQEVKRSITTLPTPQMSSKARENL